MIHLIEKNTSIFDLGMSLHNILQSSIKNHRYSQEGVFNYSHTQQLTLCEKIGHANFIATDLIHYPSLGKALRQLSALEYSIDINLGDFEKLKMIGIKSTILALEKLDILLDQHKQNKSQLDAVINNLVMLHGQQKTTPIYQGCKPYYSIKEMPRRYQSTKAIQIQLSNMKYYFNLRSNRFKKMKPLYTLEERALFKPYIDSCKKNEALLHYGYHINFIGGIINTPILVFRGKQSYQHQGKRYYLDLNTNQVYTRLNDVYPLAAYYSKNNYTIQLIEEIKK